MTVNRRELAERGARIRLAEIEAERTELLDAFPSLAPAAAAAPEPSQEEEPQPRRRKKWTAARRKAQSKRLKAIYRKKRLAEEQE